MRPEIVLTHEFVEFIPEQLEQGTLYISEKYRTAVHKCCCGCGREVVTPLSPVGWQLLYDGKTVSLHPSVGNWSLPCKSHYIIRHSRVVWAGQWTQAEVDQGRANEAQAKRRYYADSPEAAIHETAKRPGFWRRLWNWIFRSERK